MADSEISAEDIRTAILVFAHHIGIDINKDENLMYIADESLKDLPEGWELGVGAAGMDNAGIPYFFNTETGESFWHHPNEKAIFERVKNEQIRLKNIKKEKSTQKKLLASRKSSSSSFITLPLSTLCQSISNQDEKANMPVLTFLHNMMETISNFDTAVMSLGSKNALHDSIDKLLKMNLQETVEEKSESQNGSNIQEREINTILFSLFSSDSSSPDSFKSISVSHTQGKEMCKQFLLAHVTDIIPIAPIADDSLIAKLLSKFSSLWSNENSELSISPVQDLSWHELTIFCYFSAGWLLLHAVQAAKLVAEYKISFAELQAIRLVFMQYDINLYGYIIAIDIQRVLKDMSCEYDSEEINLILKVVDQDDHKKVELGDFLRWWCSIK